MKILLSGKKTSGENFFSRWIEKDVGIFGFALIAIPCVAISIVLMVWVLSILLLGTQAVVDWFGYYLQLSDDMEKTIVAVTGAVAVAVVALYGVLSQNKSAEQRHMVDASQSLKKDIFLQVAESYAMQYSYLMSFANPTVTDADRNEMVKDAGKAFNRLQAVAHPDVIAAMLETNKAWALALFELRLQNVIGENHVGGDAIERLIKIISIATPFMEKLWKFNATARKEIRTGFDNDDQYLSMMSEKFSELPKALEELRARL